MLAGVMDTKFAMQTSLQTNEKSPLNVLRAKRLASEHREALLLLHELPAPAPPSEMAA
jgi:hypothetical protein